MSTGASCSLNTDRAGPGERGDEASGGPGPGKSGEPPGGRGDGAPVPVRASGRDSSRGAFAFAVVLALLAAAIPRGEPGAIEPLVLGIPLEEPRLLILLDGAGPSLAGRADTFHKNLRTLEGAAALRRVPGIGTSLLDTWWPWLENRDPANPPRIPGSTAEPGIR